MAALEADGLELHDGGFYRFAQAAGLARGALALVFRPREGQKLLRERFHARGGGADVLRMRRALGELGVGHYDRERRPELVRGGGDEILLLPPGPLYGAHGPAREGYAQREEGGEAQRAYDGAGAREPCEGGPLAGDVREDDAVPARQLHAVVAQRPPGYDADAAGGVQRLGDEGAQRLAVGEVEVPARGLRNLPVRAQQHDEEGEVHVLGGLARRGERRADGDGAQHIYGVIFKVRRRRVVDEAEYDAEQERDEGHVYGDEFQPQALYHVPASRW